MRLASAVCALTLVAATLLGGSPASAADTGLSCPQSVAAKTTIAAGAAQGLDVTSCGARKVVTATDVAAEIPVPGSGITATAIGSDGAETSLTLVTAPDGVVSVTTGDQATGSSTAAAAVSRCSDNATHLQGVKWYAAPTFRVNSAERRPSNVAASTWKTVTAQSWSVIRNGYNSCGLSRALAVPGTLMQNSTRDANMSGNTCKASDGLSTVDFGNLGGSTVGLTCVAFSTRTGHDRIVAADVRLDNTSRSWVTTVSGCSGSRFDVRSVLTHELGHAVGLSHAAERGGDDLTMSPQITPCNASARTFGSGDLLSLSSLYPRG